MAAWLRAFDARGPPHTTMLNKIIKFSKERLGRQSRRGVRRRPNCHSGVARIAPASPESRGRRRPSLESGVARIWSQASPESHQASPESEGTRRPSLEAASPESEGSERRPNLEAQGRRPNCPGPDDLGDDHFVAKANPGKIPPRLATGLLVHDFENRLRSRTLVQTFSAREMSSLIYKARPTSIFQCL